MTVTDIKVLKGHLLKICFDNGEQMCLDRDYAADIGIKTGDLLSAEQIKEHFLSSEYQRAKSRGLWFLDRMPRSERVLYEKIVEGNILPEAAARAVARLKELGLVDDKKYAEQLFERLTEQNVSKRAAYAKMREKKIPSDIIKEVLDETETDEIGQIKNIIDKKYKNRLDDKNERQKTVAALLRRGFSYGAVRAALKEKEIEIEYGEY